MWVANPGAGEAESWLQSPTHRAWLVAQATRLLGFFIPTVDDAGHFVELDDHGLPMPTGCPPAAAPRQQLLTVARAVHSYALGEMLGIPGCEPLVARGLRTLWDHHRDPAAGGYFTAVNGRDIVDDSKSAYGHAFVLLAATSALAAGHADANQLFEDVLAVIDRYFWSDTDGAAREAFTRNWEEIEPYRGANSNMHLCESFLAAGGQPGHSELVARATRIVALLIDQKARSHDWLLPEHYDAQWRPLYEYNTSKRNDAFRPYGVTVGHLLEWSRLLLSLRLATGDNSTTLLDGAQNLFQQGVTVGWDTLHTGLVYTVDWHGREVHDDHYWWPVAEGIGASAYLARITGAPLYEAWYQRLWDYAAEYLIDRAEGGWYPQLNAQNQRIVHPWYGKPDLYHALQACLLPFLPLAPSLAAALRPGERV